MSISIEEAYQKLDILQKLSDSPELIMTDLFSKELSGINFLYQIDINGKHILDYLAEHLRMIPPFEDCIIKISSTSMSISVKALKFGKYSEFESDDCIMDIDLKGKTYTTHSQQAIEHYENVMSEKI